MKHFFYSEKVPYVFTILISIIGLQANYLIRTITEGPNVEYHYIVEKDSIHDHTRYRSMSYEIENISSDKSLKDLRFEFAFDGRVKGNPLIIDTIYSIITISPSALPESEETNNIGGNLVAFRIRNFQPGYHYILNFNTITNNDVQVFPKVYLDSGEPVRLVRASLLTWISKHQFGLNVCFLIAFIVIAIIYLTNLPKQKNEETTDNRIDPTD